LHEDGDGLAPYCAAVPGRMFASRDVVCDDHDAARNPRPTELALDGIDSNCDGRDFPNFE
jgi:hypothetical protein